MLSCRRVVNATGYFQNPHWPEILGRTTTKIPSWHSADYRSAAHVARQLGGSDKHILVIGKRLSAGQILVELVSAGFRISLSHRAPIQFGSGPLVWWIFFRIHPWLEAAMLRWQGSGARGFDVRMPGGQARRLIESGSVRRFPAIARLEDAEVGFENGERIRPDGLLFATGFRPALEHLRGLGLTVDEATGLPRTSGMQSLDVGGLFFLGLDHLRNFQSRFLRGIRRDAAILAEHLAASLSGGQNE
jgi:cation diffusion facilitator CzcD-associated flavoprotein CzcO